LSAIYSGQLHAALPSLTGITPFAANPGSSTPVKFAGKLDGMTRHVWCDDSAIVFSLPDASGNATVTVAPEAQPGLHLVRFVNSEGASQPVRFSIGLLPLLDEKEPNDDVSGAQDISKLPAWIQGKLDKPGDVDHFALYLKKGSPLLLRMDGYSLGSPVDLILHVLDAKGVKVATYSDGRNLDPQGVFTPPDDGRYILQIAGFAHPPAADVNFTGSAVCNYQIALSTGPAVDRVFPAAVSSTGKGSVEVRGVGVAPKTRVEIAPASMVGDREIVDVLPKGAIASIAVLRTAYAIATPVHASEDQPASVTVPCVVGGYFEKPAAVAAYKIVLKKGERMAARFWARSLGLDAEGELVVKGPTGEQVAANPNPSDIFSEPSVVWTAAVDGDYTLLVRDLFGRGGERYEFVVEIAPPTPSFSVEVADGKPLRVETGKTQVIKTKVVFANGWKEPLVLRVNGLPDGVFAPEVTVPEKGGDVDITLKCASNAPSGTALARIAAWTKTSPPRFVVASYSLRNELKRGDTSSDFAKDIWVTVTPPGAPVPQDPAKKK
jgi:hypothetical protein